jgi:hypothetical protein
MNTKLLKEFDNLCEAAIADVHDVKTAKAFYARLSRACKACGRESSNQARLAGMLLRSMAVGEPLSEDEVEGIVNFGAAKKSDFEEDGGGCFYHAYNYDKYGEIQGELPPRAAKAMAKIVKCLVRTR